MAGVNRALGNRIFGGRIIYFHVSDTALAGDREFFKGPSAIFPKEALIISFLELRFHPCPTNLFLNS